MKKAMKEVRLPRLIRHNLTGVWICYILGPGLKSNTITVEGRRIWSWNGDRLECSEVSVKGVRPNDRLGAWVHAEIPVGEGDELAEIIYMEEALVEAARNGDVPRTKYSLEQVLELHDLFNGA